MWTVIYISIGLKAVIYIIVILYTELKQLANIKEIQLQYLSLNP